MTDNNAAMNNIQPLADQVKDYGDKLDTAHTVLTNAVNSLGSSWQSRPVHNSGLPSTRTSVGSTPTARAG